MKTCRKCSLELSLESFYGSDNTCKECRKARIAELYFAKHEERLAVKSAYRERNRETLRRKQLAYRAEHVEECRARDKAYGARNAEAARARAKAWRTAYPERFKEARRNWEEANPEKVRAHWERSNERRRVGRDEESQAYGRIVINDPCVYCGEPATTIEHIRPVSSGGISHWTNIAGACLSCNQRKNASELLHFLVRERG